jgi:hypothetical protein
MASAMVPGPATGHFFLLSHQAYRYPGPHFRLVINCLLLSIVVVLALNVESEPSVMPSMLPPPPPPPLPPPPLPPPPQDASRAVRRLAMMESQQAADYPLPPSPESGVAGPTPESPSPPASPSPVEDCSQSMLEEHEQRNGPLPGHEKVGAWLCDVQAGNASTSPSPVRYPTPPAAPPFTFVDTGLYQGGRYDWYHDGWSGRNDSTWS